MSEQWTVTSEGQGLREWFVWDENRCEVAACLMEEDARRIADEHNELAALRRSHAEAVEAAVREIEAMDANFFNRLSVIRAIRKHLGPAAAGEKGE